MLSLAASGEARAAFEVFSDLVTIATCVMLAVFAWPVMTMLAELDQQIGAASSSASGVASSTASSGGPNADKPRNFTGPASDKTVRIQPFRRVLPCARPKLSVQSQLQV